MKLKEIKLLNILKIIKKIKNNTQVIIRAIISGLTFQ